MDIYLDKLSGREAEPMNEELVFETTQNSDGGYVAECLTEGIFTQADDWDELRSNVQEAVEAYFGDEGPPRVLRLHLVKEELLPSVEWDGLP